MKNFYPLTMACHSDKGRGKNWASSSNFKAFSIIQVISLKFSAGADGGPRSQVCAR